MSAQLPEGLDAFLEDAGWGGAEVEPLPGDASFRRYFRLRRRDVAAILESWLAERGGGLDDPVFPSSRGGFLSADALQRLVERHVATTTAACPSLAARSITPHTLCGSPTPVASGASRRR